MSGIGLYFHVPFCRRKCSYCNFYSAPATPEQMAAYTEAVCRNLRHYTSNTVADTLYFGGGTPSLLAPEQLEQILARAAACFSIPPDAEITLEANPATLTPENLHRLRAAGVNRLSLGVQSLSDAQLRRLGRMHTAQEALDTAEAAAGAGFRNISCDVMLALPKQTPAELSETLEQMAQLPIQHISAYLLKIESGTPFARQHAEQECPDEDTAADLYLQTVRTLEQAGFASTRSRTSPRPVTRAGTTASTGTVCRIWASARQRTPAGRESAFLCRQIRRISWRSRCSEPCWRTHSLVRRRSRSCWGCA
ncbi:MAG: coproporphyrinogen-III oxidase family protein [Ruminococcus sp.]